MPVDDLTFGIRGEPDPSSWTNAGRQNARAYGKGFDPIKGIIQRSIDAASDSMGVFGDEAKAAFRKAEAGAKQADDAAEKLDGTARKLRENMGDAGDAAKKLGTVSATAFSRGDDAAEKFEKGLVALITRARAVRDSLKATGQNQSLLANYDHQLRELLDIQKTFQEQSERVGQDPGFVNGLRAQIGPIEKVLDRETQIYKNATLRFERQQDRKERVAKEANDTIRANEDRAQKQLTNITQQQTTLRNAQIRTEANRAIQASQRTARVRIELLKFTFRRLQTIERSIGAVFKGTAAVVAGAFARVERTVFRIGGVFKRGNKDFTQGLSPALNRREGIIRRSFSRQEANVRGSVARQSVTLQRFETQASTGIAGALTGRSSLGALFGGGLAIGGGFSLFRKLSQSIQVGGDFIQGLAVLQAQLQLTEKEMVGVRQLSIDLGNDITLPGVSALDAAQAIAALAKQFGALGDAALPAAEAAAKGVLSLSRATGSTAEEAAAIVGAATNVFGISADEAVATADKVTAALTVSAGVGISDFKDAFTQGAAVFSSFQKPVLGAEGALVEFNTALAVLARGGLTGSQAGTGLKQFFIQSVKAGDSFVALRKQIAETAGVSGSVFFDADGGAREFTDSIDILRKGLAGLTDEAKQTTLIKLFGARASTVALNLIGANPEDFDLIREAQERQGAAAEVAEAQNVGLRGALDALGSVIETQQIKTYEKWQGAAAKVTLKLADMFQAFFDGTGIMEKVRTAIVGVTIALGGLLALKGAFELTKFLGIGLTGLISPLGIVVVGVAALGGAIAVLLKSSESFGDALGNIGSSLGSAVVPVLEFAGDLLAKFFNLIDEKVVPSIVNFSVALAESLGNQVDRFIRFLQADAIPALVKFKDAFVEIAGPIVRDVFEFLKGVVNPVLERLGQLIDITVVPAFNRLAEILGDKVDPALQKVREVGGAIRDEIGPLIQPAVDAFRELGEAIGAIAGKRTGTGFTDSDFGDLSALIPAFQNVVSGIAQSFANIAERIIDVLGPQIPRVIGFIVSQFSEDKLLAIVAAFGNIAEGIGKTFGAIASSPEFLGALAAIAGTAGFLAVKFLEGLARGLAVGLPRTFDVLKDELGPAFNDLLKAAFNPVNIGKAIIAAFALASIGRALTTTMRRDVDAAGKKVGDGFAKSFAKQVRFGLGAGTSRNQFAQGFFAGGIPGLQRQADQAAAAASAASAKVERGLTSRLQNLGVPRFAEGFYQSTAEQLDTLGARLGGKTRLLGAEIRASVGNIVGGFKTIGTGLREALTDAGARFSSNDIGAATIKRGFDRIGLGFRAGFAALKGNLQVLGAGVGQATGGAILGGLGAALSGQQLASGNTLIGLSGLAASALLAFQTTSSGLIAGAVVGVGLLTAEWTKVKNRTKDARVEAEKLVTVYESALAGATGLEAKIRAAGQEFINQIAALSPDAKALFDDFDVRGFTEGVLEGTVSAQDGFKALLESAGFTADQIDQYFRGGSDSLADFQRDLRKPKNLLGLTTGPSRFEGFFPEVDGDELAAFSEAIGIVINTIEGVPDAIEGLDLKGTLEAKLSEVSGISFGFFRIPIKAEFVAGGFGDFADGIEGVANATLGNIPVIFEAIEDAATLPIAPIGKIEEAIESLNLTRTTPIQNRINEITTEIDFLKETVSTTRDEIKRLIEGDYKNSLQETLDNITLALPDIGANLTDALANTDIDRGPALVRQILGKDFSGLVSQFISKGIAEAELEGTPITEDFLRKLVEPIQGLIGRITIPLEVDDGEGGTKTVQVALSDEAQAELNQAVFDLIPPELIANLDFVSNTEATIEGLKEDVEKLNLEINATFIFDADAINAELERLFGPGVYRLLSEGRALDIQAPQREITQSEILALVEQQRLALEGNAPQTPATVPGPNQEIFNYEFNVEQNITGSEPIPTAAESVHALVALASGGRLELV